MKSKKVLILFMLCIFMTGCGNNKVKSDELVIAYISGIKDECKTVYVEEYEEVSTTKVKITESLTGNVYYTSFENVVLVTE